TSNSKPSMTIAQKFLVFAALAVAVGAGLYQTRQASDLRQQVLALQEQQASSAKHIAELETSMASAKKQLGHAKENNNRLTAEVQKLSKRDAARAAAAGKPEGPKGLAAMFGGNGTNGMSGMMSKVMKNAMEQQLQGKMTSMKAKLNLTPDQETAIHDILAQQAEKGMAVAQKMFNGDGVNTNELAQTAKDMPNQDAQIKALLTSDQSTAYDAWQKEETANNVRLMANMELIQIQPMLQLDQPTQDKVFAILAEQGQATFDAKENNPAAAADFRGQMERKAQALSAVLTPDQLASYRKFQEQQLSIIEAFKK
ncbi:MAG TPA: hypothetical protein VFC44_10485, partial [Candidatus Saccharimonadales bacterium]|nr:hypothetical protein [Candidatus Saccharimonadales bacterium]